MKTDATTSLSAVIERFNSRFVAAPRPKSYRFDVFKGCIGPDGIVTKLRTIGSAQLMEGTKTYTVYLKPLLKDVFYLLPETQRRTRGDYVILTREPSQTAGRKYFWNNVGEAFILDSMNPGLMRLSFDLFGDEHIYMSLHPLDREPAPNVTTQEAV